MSEHNKNVRSSTNNSSSPSSSYKNVTSSRHDKTQNLLTCTQIFYIVNFHTYQTIAIFFLFQSNPDTNYRIGIGYSATIILTSNNLLTFV